MECLILNFTNLIYIKDDGIIHDILWAIVLLMENDPLYIENIVDNVNMKRVIELLEFGNPKQKVACLRIIGTATCHSDVATEDLVALDCLKPLKKILLNNDGSSNPLIKEACWVISNIAVENIRAIQVLISLDIIKLLCNLVIGFSAFSVKQEAVWAISNACTSANDIQIWQMVNDGILSAFLVMLDEKEANCTITVLEAIKRVLEVGQQTEDNKIAEEWKLLGGLEKLEELQLCKNTRIYELVIKILEDNYELTESDPNEIRKIL